MVEQHRFLSRSLEDCPFYAITRTSLLTTSAFKRTLAAAGLSEIRPAYLAVLWCLWEEEGVHMTELARSAKLEPSTMTGLLDRMERAGLVSRRADPGDRRALTIHLSKTGRDLQETCEKLVAETLDMLFEGIGDKELEVTLETLRRVMVNSQGGA